MKKKLFTWLTVLFLTVLLCSGCMRESEPQTVSVAVLSGPTGIGMSQMIADGVDCGKNVTVDFTVATAPDQVVASVINGEYQIAALPTNLAATLYNKTKGAVVLGAVNTLGTLSIVAKDGLPVQQISDLKGKTIVATGQGSTPEIVLTTLLKKAGLSPEQDVTIEWYAEHSEAAAKLAAGKADAAMLPEPFATVTMIKNPDLVRAVDLTKAWEDATKTKLTMGCVVINADWAKNHPDILKKFMKAYRVSVENIAKADETAVNAVVKAGIMEQAALAQKAIPNCAMTFLTPSEAKNDLMAYFDILASFDAKSVGGKVPDDGFYAISY